MTLIEKNSNVNKIFESNKSTKIQQQKLVQIESVFEKTNINMSIKNSPKNTNSNFFETNHDIDSRRSSGNSIKIKITNDNNITVEEDSLECILNENYSILNENERKLIEDFDYEIEETTSNSNSMNHLERINSKKKLKERKKLVRSSAQQKHFLVNQESEDQPDMENTFNSVEALNEANPIIEFKSQNSAFDELFAAAKTGNFIKSAHVEAKMAIAASKNEINDYDDIQNDEKESYFSKKKFLSGKSNNNSFRNRNSFKKVSPSDNSDSTDPVSLGFNNLKINENLGSPQQLTRSCSCKRPGSFKKMRAKNEIKSNNQKDSLVQNNSIASVTVSPPSNTNPSSRRGTNCSIVLKNELDKENRCCSIPLDNLNNNQSQHLTLDLDQTDIDICRVRKFNITNKGSIINRGDSFKRSFKRSNNSLSSKKDVSPSVNYDNNTLNLPDFQECYLNKSNNSINYNDISEKSDTLIVKNNDNDSYALNTDKNIVIEDEKFTNNIKTYLVYMLGASR
jgi:hypothetical protein